MSHAANPEVQKILDHHIEKIAGVRSAVVLSDEGTHMYWTGMDAPDAERRAPMAAALSHLAGRYATEEGGGVVRRALVEMEDGFVMVSRVGRLAHLALGIVAEANLGTIAFEVTLLTKRLAHVLDAELRQPLDGEASA